VRTGGRGKHNSFEFCGAFCSAKILHCFLLPQNTKSGGGESEGAAEGGCGGNSAAPSLLTENFLAALFSFPCPSLPARKRLRNSLELENKLKIMVL